MYHAVFQPPTDPLAFQHSTVNSSHTIFTGIQTRTDLCSNQKQTNLICILSFSSLLQNAQRFIYVMKACCYGCPLSSLAIVAVARYRCCSVVQLRITVTNNQIFLAGCSPRRRGKASVEETRKRVGAGEENFSSAFHLPPTKRAFSSDPLTPPLSTHNTFQSLGNINFYAQLHLVCAHPVNQYRLPWFSEC